MKKVLLLTIGFFIMIHIHAQNSTTCDSLYIDCCSFSTGQNTISLVASNFSSYLFDYPGFILYNTSMDTVAIEEVNYFGIGTDQIHVLDIVSPIDLPFEGILELYTLFYDTLWCTYEVFIPDTVETSIDRQEISEFHIYPNPADKWVIVEPVSPGTQNYTRMIISDIFGRVWYKCHLPAEGVKLRTHLFGEPGLYFLSFQDQSGTVIENRRLIIH